MLMEVQKLLYNNYQLLMFRKFHLNKIQGSKYAGVEEQFQQLNSNFEQLLLKTIKTPSQRNLHFDELEIMKTQKLLGVKKNQSNCGLLQARRKLQPLSKDDMPELGLRFKQKTTQACQTDRVGEKRDFMIRKMKNTSFSYIHKDKSEERSDQSLEKDNKPSNIRTDPHQGNGRQQRTKGHSKYQQPACKIAHTKKLPFHLCDQNEYSRKEQIPAPDWNVSIIAKRDENVVPSFDSYQELRDLL